MSFPTTTYTDNESAASGFVSNAAQQGLSVSGLNAIAQLQSAVANLLLDEPTGSVELADLAGFGATGGYIRSNGSAFVRVSGLDPTDLSTVVPASKGGTGVANTATITLAGALVTSGANSLTFTTTGTTSVTLPTSGTLVNSAVTTLSSLATVSATLGFGGATSAFPMLKRSSTALQARLADDSNYAPFAAASYAVGATAGASGGPFTAVTGITVVNGIVTAISGT